MKMRTSSGARVDIHIEPSGEGSRVVVQLSWRTSKPLTIENAVAFLHDLDQLGIEYIVSANDEEQDSPTPS